MKYVLWLLFALSLALLLVWKMIPLNDGSARIQTALQTLHARPVPLTPNECDFFKGTNIVKLSVKTSQGKAWVFIIDATHNRHVIHDPRFCFQGAGWKLIQENPLSLANGSAMELLLSRGNQTKKFAYWFSNGENSYHSFIRYWLSCTLRRLSCGLSSQEPILIMVEPYEGTNSTTLQFLEELKMLWNV